MYQHNQREGVEGGKVGASVSVFPSDGQIEHGAEDDQREEAEEQVDEGQRVPEKEGDNDGYILILIKIHND